MMPLTKICLMIPADDSESVLVSSHVPKISEGGRRWKVACGLKKLPPMHTSYPPACTCKKCLDYVEEHLKKDPLPEPDDPSLPEIQVTLEDDPPNPFVDELS